MNYTELVDAAKAYADRQDIEVNQNIDLFISMVESKVNRILKTREQCERWYTAIVPGVEYYSPPLDYAGMRDCQINIGSPAGDHKSYTVTYLNPEQFNIIRNQPSMGKMFYSFIANQIQIFPATLEGATLEITYYQKVPPISSTGNQTNWLLESHPDIYLSGLISEIEAFAKNYDVSALWQKRMSLAAAELDSSDEVERWSGNQLTMRVE